MMGWLYRLGDLLRYRARLRKWSADQAAGRYGEDLAHRFLQRQGLIVVARNLRTQSGDGELDLVAREGGRLVFVEVKTRTTDEFSAPDRAIDHDKRQRIAAMARGYAARAGADPETVRFDVVSVVLSKPARIHHQRDAFGEKSQV